MKTRHPIQPLIAFDNPPVPVAGAGGRARQESYDPLSSLPNRRTLLLYLGALIAQWKQRIVAGYAVLALDLADLSIVSDRLGHQEADRLLFDVASRLEEGLCECSLIALLGSDVLLVVLVGPFNERNLLPMAMKALALFDKPFLLQNQSIFFNTNVGLVIGQSDCDSPKEVLDNANTVIRRARSLGRRTIAVFDSRLRERAHEQFVIANDLRRALDEKLLRAFYQPVIDFATNKIVGCESLIRLQHPKRGLISPGEFLPVAEELGLTPALDWWMLRETCAHLKKWQPLFGSNFFCANVNLDDRQLKDPNFVSELAALLRDTEIDPRTLGLEVTETVFRNDMGELTRILKALKELQVVLLIDDFGTGFSSLESLAAAPFDVLKIDQSFVKDLETNPRHQAIIRSIGGLAKDLGLRLSAEGVETLGQASVLASFGCTTAQGFLYSRPVDEDQMLAFIKQGAIV